MTVFASVARILQGVLSFGTRVRVGDVHDVQVTLVRDQSTQPVVEWVEDQCFKLTFNNPYTTTETW